VRNIKLTIEYDGTPFSGWQRQSRRPSVQAEVERAIRAVTHERVTLTGAGRTDAGVHALGQVANFKTQTQLAATRVPAAMNAHLPPTIPVVRAADVPPAFHARFAATARIYRYAVLNRPAPSAILRHHAYHVPYPLQLNAMSAAMASLQGAHAFAAFRGGGRAAKAASVCTLRRAEVARSGDMVIFTFEADRFLHHMVRMMVGTLLKVGKGSLSVDAVSAILSSNSSQRAGPRVPAHGLYLVSVTYPSE
jgi:tRNA pseudouridine38-40 synthase